MKFQFIVDPEVAGSPLSPLHRQVGHDMFIFQPRYQPSTDFLEQIIFRRRGKTWSDGVEGPVWLEYTIRIWVE